MQKIGSVLAGLALAVASPLLADEARTLRLADGVEMAYVERGAGDPSLVFVHCANCRKEIWRETLDAFAATHRVVAMDLAGHGSSGANRERFTIDSLGADVAALVEHLKLPRVILVGNSLGGPVSLEAAKRLGPSRVLAVVAVDTLHNVELVWPEEDWRRRLDAYRKDFRPACNELMLALVPKKSPPAVRERIDRETCENDPRAAISLFETFRTYNQAAAMRAAGVPVWAINSTSFIPTNADVNRKHGVSFEAILMEDVGHYPHIERPEEFQRHLRRVIDAVATPAAAASPRK
ncbi:MAG TPA: alpha/beta hydrolase [Thermoanaerobaculia bacterium]